MSQDTQKAPSLYGRGGRKYLTSIERKRFKRSAQDTPPNASILPCADVGWGSASETLALRPMDFDFHLGCSTIRDPEKARARRSPTGSYPASLLNELENVVKLREAQSDPIGRGRRRWSWSRTTAWRYVKRVMAAAGIRGTCAMPKGLRHGFGVATFQIKVPPHLVQRRLGHASLHTTAIYGDVIGLEERSIAARM